ncbi:FtsK/SpoIIIE domain-containing protein [Succinimonas sp.]|uniref:FtsK/SpoIIIE domain-containing protein n=1 Tax=Succinimonas sp. TaxID=1936151 RepID=UPI0038658756
MSEENIDGLLKRLDEVILRRENGYRSIDREYTREDGTILAKRYDEYRQRKQYVTERADKDSLDCQQKLDDMCRNVRKWQPALVDIENVNLNRIGRFPRWIALGKYHVRYKNLDFYVPQLFRFPLEKPMYIADDRQTELFHKVLLRLMYALPANKQQYYIFDPIGMGRGFWIFNQLFPNQKLFPQGKVMTTVAELKTALQDVSDYISNLYSNFFSIGNDCPDWDSCNRRFCSQGRNEKMLPYKIFIFMDVPEEMNADCFATFRKLILHGAECGFLVLFSFNDTLLQAEDSKMKAQELLLRELVDISLPAHAVLDRKINDVTYARLQIKSIGEKFPDSQKLRELLNAFQEEVGKDGDEFCSFDRILPREELFHESSAKKLSIPCGYAASGGNELSIEIGDRVPHYLIGGTTGSGKSNLLHNIIVSSMWHYGPNDLSLFLLDFKEGVEFSRYASPPLPGIALVAVEADTEYGISVLRHLNDEKNARYAKFKKCGCKDILAYRQLHPEDTMPRVLIIIDEFQILFESNEKDQTIASMTTLAKQGRACGIHMVLATQTLKGVDFGSLGTQFSGRIALNCPAEDSKLFLGGLTSNNEAAANLEIPYAIINTAQGNPSKNIKFAVPEATSEAIAYKLAELRRETDRKGYSVQTKIFEGQKFPKLPPDEFFRKDCGFVLTLGEILNYDSDPLRLGLHPSPASNLLLCGHDTQMKLDFLIAIMRSSLGCQDCEEIIYIGEDGLPEMFAKDRIKAYADARRFVDAEKAHYFDRKRIIIIDNENLTKSVGFPPTSYGKKDPYFESFMEFWEEANRNSTHIIAFYDGINRIKACGAPLTDFQYRIGYNVSTEEYNYLLGNLGPLMRLQIGQRAFFADNQTIKAWFKPYRS